MERVWYPNIKTGFLGTLPLKVVIFLLIMQNMERVVKSREVYTPSLNFTRLILYNFFSIKKMMFYELGDYCISLVFCTIKMVVFQDHKLS